MAMAHHPNRLRLFVTGLPSTAANQTPGIGTVRRTAGDEAAVRSLSKDSSHLAPLSMTKLWIALVGVVSENGKNSTLRRATAFT